VGLLVLSAAAFFVGTGYIALDTGLDYTSRFAGSLVDPNRNIGLYVLYQLAPLIFLVGFFILESVLVLKVLGERKPMREWRTPPLQSNLPKHRDSLTPSPVYLAAAALLFAIGQIFQYVINTHICQGTNGKIDGSLFETLFTLLSVVTLWIFWSSITEDDWPMQPSYPMTE
jgi:hypothetical protein